MAVFSNARDGAARSLGVEEPHWRQSPDGPIPGLVRIAGAGDRLAGLFELLQSWSSAWKRGLDRIVAAVFGFPLLVRFQPGEPY